MLSYTKMHCFYCIAGGEPKTHRNECEELNFYLRQIYKLATSEMKRLYVYIFAVKKAHPEILL